MNVLAITAGLFLVVGTLAFFCDRSDRRREDEALERAERAVQRPALRLIYSEAVFDVEQHGGAA